MSGRRLAIFGGTFDPIHDAHVAIARTAAERFRLDRILFVPAERPPHKAGVTHAPYEDRIRMVELACQDDGRFEASRLEQGTVRSYSIETIEKLRAQTDPASELFFIIGADAFAEIRTWRRWQDVARAVCFLVVARPGYVYAAPAEVSYQPIADIDLSISSSVIRRELAAGLKPAGVPERVLEYIFEHGLYAAPAQT